MEQRSKKQAAPRSQSNERAIRSRWRPWHRLLAHESATSTLPMPLSPPDDHAAVSSVQNEEADLPRKRIETVGVRGAIPPTPDLVVVSVIAVLGLVVAVVTFGLFQSSATVQSDVYSLGGAFGAAVVSWSILIPFYNRSRNSTVTNYAGATAAAQELERLQRENAKLKSKLTRSVRRPAGWEIEVDERLQVALARPSGWVRRGVIFDFQEDPHDRQKRDDLFPMEFKVSYGLKPDGYPDADRYYAWFRDRWYDDKSNRPWMDSYTVEYVYVGGEQSKVKSLKIISDCFAEIPTDEAEPYVNWDYVKRDVFEEGLKASLSNIASSSAQDVLPDTGRQIRYARIRKTMIVCYHQELDHVYFFEGIDNVDDFTTSTETFNDILDSVRFLI